MNVLSYAHLQTFTHPKDILDTYFTALILRNKEKYGSYVRAMKFLIHVLGLLPGTMRKGGNALVYQYVSCRGIDDVIDNDFPDIGFDIVAYAEKRFHFVESLLVGRSIPETAEDRLILEAFRIARMEGKEKELYESFRMIIQSMQFDAKRIKAFRGSNTLEFLPQAELDTHFYNLDIVGTGTGMLVYLGSRDIPKDIEKVNRIGKACRIEYNLHDFVEDLEHGILNISSEDAQKYDITLGDLKKVIGLRALPRGRDDPAKILYQDLREYPLSVQRWISDQIGEYHKNMREFMEYDYNDFPFITRQVFQQFYIKPTQKSISKISSLLYA